MFCLIADIALSPRLSASAKWVGQWNVGVKRKAWYLLHVWNFHSIYTRNSVIQIVLTSLCHELGEISFIIVHVVYTVHLEPLWSGDCYPVRVCAAGICVWLHWFVYRIWPFKCWAQIDAGSTHFYKTRFVLQWLGMVETAQMVSLGQWKAEDPGFESNRCPIFFLDIYWVQSSF